MTGVFSYPKRDRQSHIRSARPSDPTARAKTRRPRFSFFSSSIVKKQTPHQGQKQPLPWRFSETSSASASSAAALVSDRLIRPHPENSQHRQHKKFQENDKSMKSLRNLESKADSHKSSNQNNPRHKP